MNLCEILELNTLNTSDVLKCVPMVGVGVSITKTPNVFRFFVEKREDIGEALDHLLNAGFNIKTDDKRGEEGAYSCLIWKGQYTA